MVSVSRTVRIMKYDPVRTITNFDCFSLTGPCLTTSDSGNSGDVLGRMPIGR